MSTNTYHCRRCDAQFGITGENSGSDDDQAAEDQYASDVDFHELGGCTPKNIDQAVSVTFTLGMNTVVGQGFDGYDLDGEPMFNAPITIANLVADRLAQQLLTEAKKGVDYPSISQRISAGIDEAVARKIGGALEREIVPTDAYGQSKGEPTTLTELIGKRAQAWLTEPQASRGGYGPKPTNLQALIDEAVGRAFKGEIQKAVKEAQAAAVAEVSKQAAEVFAEIIKRAAT